MKINHLPNALSILRIILTVPIVVALLKAQFLLTLALFAIAALTDGLDGFIAKHFNCQTNLGAMLDPLADKILLASSFITLFYIGLIPLWLVVIILIRDVVLIAGAVGYYYEVGIEDSKCITPSKISKLNTFLQIVSALLTIIAQLYIPLLDILFVLYVIVATSTLLSGIDYAWVWTQRAIGKNSRDHIQ